MASTELVLPSAISSSPKKLALFAEHQRAEIAYDASGAAFLPLSGSKAGGRCVKVPPHLWHLLTFKKKKWTFDNEYIRGTWDSKTTTLHGLIYRILHPDYVPEKGRSITFENRDRLDCRETNLVLASDSDIGRNKKKRDGASSKHFGISHEGNLWVGKVKVDGVCHRVSNATEDGAVVMLTDLKQRLLGDSVRLVANV